MPPRNNAAAPAGAEHITLYVAKFFRHFPANLQIHNRRELASWVGITPTPWASGDTKLSIVDSPEGSDAQAAAKIATLTRLKGIGENDATLLIHEIFSRPA